MWFHVGKGVNWNGIGLGGARSSVNVSRISFAMVAMSFLSSLMRSEIAGVVSWGLSVEWSSRSISLAGAGVFVFADSTALFICSIAEFRRVRSVASSVLITCNSAA